jgi:hypothetical protein
MGAAWALACAGAGACSLLRPRPHPGCKPPSRPAPTPRQRRHACCCRHVLVAGRADCVHCEPHRPGPHGPQRPSGHQVRPALPGAGKSQLRHQGRCRGTWCWGRPRKPPWGRPSKPNWCRSRGRDVFRGAAGPQRCTRLHRSCDAPGSKPNLPLLYVTALRQGLSGNSAGCREPTCHPCPGPWWRAAGLASKPGLAAGRAPLAWLQQQFAAATAWLHQSLQRHTPAAFSYPDTWTDLLS